MYRASVLRRYQSVGYTRPRSGIRIARLLTARISRRAVLRPECGHEGDESV